MKKKVFSLMMAFAFGLFGLLQAQVSLPFTEGFENGIGEWTKVNCHSSSVVIGGSAIHSGNNGFQFRYTSELPQYLISPQLSSGSNGVALEFWYKAYSSYYQDGLQVGYSTTTNDVNAFTFGEEIYPVPTSWTQFSNVDNPFPAGTKYVAFKSTRNGYYLFLDDISFTAAAGGSSTNSVLVAVQDSIDVDTVLVGVRPNGCWMEPFKFQMRNDGEAITLNLIDFTPQEYFTVVAPELPVRMANGETIDVKLATGTSTNTEWQMVGIYEGARTAKVWTIMAEPYDPECPDVWEKAYDVTNETFPFVETPMERLETYQMPQSDYTQMLHNDYTLPFPEIAEGYDAVYKLTVAEDAILNAYVSFGDSAGSKVAVYTEDFNGKGGPMADNNYTGFGLASGNRDNLTYDFEDGILGWTTIDADGDGYDWMLHAPDPNFISDLGHEGSDYYVHSQSYDNETDVALTPDNYLVSPSKAEYTAISFWACAQDPNYAAEHFGVAVSTAGNTSASDFTMVQEWTMTAKSAGNAGNYASRSREGSRGTWYEYTVDLSAYAGQEIWVAIRHFNCTDMFILNVDDITIVEGAGGVTPTPGPTPGPNPNPVANISAGPVVEGLPLTPGTYYIVASSITPDFELTIGSEPMPCPEVDGFAFNPYPADDQDSIQPSSVKLTWQTPVYATEWRVVFGSTYYPEANHPQTIITDWSNELTNSYTVTNLWNNTNYFWHVEFRNGACSTVVSSPIWGFTTHLNIPQNLTVEDDEIFIGDTVKLSWTAVVDRTYRNYFVYRDGEKIGETTANQIGLTTFTDNGPFAYNMTGYTYYVTAVYDEGESYKSNTVTVKVSGEGSVSGYVYEQDSITGIAGATVTLVGTDEFGDEHTYTATTNNNGFYTATVYVGSYKGSASCPGYQSVNAPVQGNPVAVAYNQTTSPVNFILDESFDGPCTVVAEYYPDSLDPNSPYVKVYWGCGLPSSAEEIVEPFETGDFSLFDWQLDATYPWTITTTNPYEGTYCMKSGGAGVGNAVSNMTVTVDIPADGEMSFFGKISSESQWDYGYFLIDGVQKARFTGEGNWVEKKFDITAGSHTFQWRYQKDGSFNVGDDCFYVDNITFYRAVAHQPATAGWHTYLESEFDNAYKSNVGNCSWGYEYPVSVIGAYAGFNLTKVALFSDDMYGAVGGNFTCNVYVGGNTPGTGTLASTITVDVPVGLGEWCEYDLTTPVAVTGNQPLWVTWTANTTSGMGYPAGGASHYSEYGNWFNNGQDGWEQLSGDDEITWTMKNYFTNRGRTVVLADADTAPVVIESPVTINNNLRTFVKGQEDNTRACINPNATTQLRVENNLTRRFSHYRVYRTSCYNDGPYDSINTMVLACEYSDTVFIDTYWNDPVLTPPGVYKWGIGAVYVGNRGELVESPISWGAPVTITRDATADNDPNPVSGEEGVRAPWDLMATFNAAEASQYGVVTDGQYIYTSNWGYSGAAHNFYKYDMQGNMIEGFEIPDCGTLRGMTFDGQYVYGVANSSTVYCVDLNNHTLVNTFTSGFGAAQRGITYDPERDGFWVIGNWTGNLTLINRQGAVQFTGPAPTSVSDLAYYKDENDVEHVFCFNNSDNGVYDYNITTNTLGGSVFNLSVTPGLNSGNSGGCHVAEYNGKVAFFGDLQQDPNLIGIYELRDGGGVGPNPGPGPAITGDPIQEPRESVIVWSNCLSKDMNLADGDVTINVLLNSADSPEGVSVKFVNCDAGEQENYPVAPVILDETGFYSYPEFRKGNYNLTIEMPGYYPITDSLSIWSPVDLRYVMTEIIKGIDSLYVSRTGWAMWVDSEDAYDGRHLEYYKVMCTSIDDQPIFNANTTRPFCQVNTQDLVEGDLYKVMVAAVYSTGWTGWSQPVVWEYESCEHYDDVAVVGSTATNGNMLSWGGDGPTPPTPPTPPTGSATVILTAGDVWGDGSGYQMLLDSDATAYGTTIPAEGALSSNCSGNDAIYAAFEYKIPVNADGNCSTQNIVINNSISIEIPAGTYDWCIANPTPGDRIWIASSQGNIGGRQDDYVFEAGRTYEFTVSMNQATGNDQTNVVISGGGKNTYAPLPCGEVRSLDNLSGGIRDSWSFFQGFVTNPGAMSNGTADGSWTQGSQTTLGPNGSHSSGRLLADEFTIDVATTINSIEVYAYQTGSTTTSTFTGLYAQIYNGSPMAGGTAVWGDGTTNIMTATAFTNCYRGSIDLTRPIMSITADGLNIQLQPGTYYLVYSLAGSLTSGPWGVPHCEPGIGNTGNGMQYSTDGWILLNDSGSNTPYGLSMKLTGVTGNNPNPNPNPISEDVLGFMIFRDGEWLAELPATATSFVDEGEFGAHDYLVRVIYDGTAVLPSNNYYYAMSCGTEVTVGNQNACAPGAPIHAEVLSATDQVRIWWDEEPSRAADMTSFRVYRSKSPAGGYALIGEVAANSRGYYEYIDTPATVGTFYYQVTTVYSNGCESNPALSYVDPSVDYVFAMVTSIDENGANVNLYPNPTSGNVTIEAQGMSRVTVMSVLGQVVYDSEINADECTINMSQFNAGMYVVRINSESGVSVKRVTVIR